MLPLYWGRLEARPKLLDKLLLFLIYENGIRVDQGEVGCPLKNT